MPSDPGLALATAELDLEAAWQLLRDGRMLEAEQASRRVLADKPDHLQALRFLAGSALRRGAAGEAVDLLNRAANIDRCHIGTLMELGIAYRMAERMDASRYVLERVLELGEGRNTTARLLLANVLELDQRPELSLLQYFRAIIDAQQTGRWHDDATTEPTLRALVRHAMRYVTEGRRDLFNAALQPWREHIDSLAMERIDRALAVYLREADEPPGDSRQRAGLLHIHGLGTSPRVGSESPEWLRTLLSRMTTLTTEIDACWTPTSAAQTHASSLMVADSEPETAQPHEQRIDLHRSGNVPDTIRRRAPQLLAALADTPLLRVARHGPNAALISLPSGTHTLPQHGCSNSRCTVVAGLPNSARVEIHAGSEPFQVGAGEAMLFDASYAIEYVNRSETEARLLVFDVWHPVLGHAEQQAVGALLTAMVDFDTQLQDLA
jgi:aspartate beta-hydroxylase